MAIINNPLMTGASGRIGDLVFFSRNGKTFVKQSPIKRKRNSAHLKTQQEKFKLMMRFLRPLRSFIYQVHKGPGDNTAHFNKILSENLRTAIIGKHPDLSINYSKLILSKGELPNAREVPVSSKGPGKLVLNWKYKRSQAMTRSTDDAFLACYDEGADLWILKTELAKRKSESCSLDVETFKGKTVHLYFGFSSSMLELNSDSLYLGKAKVL